jgi:uncharacterized protein (TIGR02147 family)
MRKDDPNLSFRELAKQIGFKSPNYIVLVTTGKRNLTKDSIEKINAYFKHDPNEALFFENLVYFNQAQNLEEKIDFSKKMLSSALQSQRAVISGDTLNYYTNWYNVLIREVIGLACCDSNPRWIQQKLRHEISLKEISESLNLLLSLGLIKESSNGKFEQVEKDIKTPETFSSQYVRTYHLTMMSLASKAMLEIDKDMRDITAATFSISETKIPEIKKAIAKFRQDMIAATLDEKDTDQVFQLNIQFFPLTK